MDISIVENTGITSLSNNMFQHVQTDDTGTVSKNESSKENPGQEKSATSEMMKEIVESVQEQISMINSSLSFQAYGRDNDKMAIVVSDKTTGKIIREIPAKEVQEMQAKLDELIGLIYNGSA